ncbi:MAG TPA: HPr kinase/phosphorylase, partial [Lactobacillus sp.]|nr:HPr kinase/phosphorylase [Lactobacillus sp.]
MANTVNVKKLVADISNLEVYSGEQYLEERQITTEDISRPGLELTGYFDYYPEERIQLFG